MRAARSTSIPAFLYTVFRQVWTYVVYGGGAAVLSIWGYLIRQTPPAWGFLAVIAIGFFVAAYRVWQIERRDYNDSAIANGDLYQKLHDAENRFARELRTIEPFVTLDLEHVMARPVADVAGSIEILAKVTIQNTGQDTDLHNWTLRSVREPTRNKIYGSPSWLV